jgi:hypothetical protein
MIAIILAAPNTPSGNPRRVALVLEQSDYGAEIREAVDIGYLSAAQALEQAGYKTLVPLGDWIKVSATEYKRHLKTHAK